MNKKGFTLVEVAVSVALFAVLAYAGTAFFIQAIRDSNKVAIENEVRETAAGIMADITMETKGLANMTNSGRYCVAKTADNLTVYLSDSPANTPNCAANSTRQIIYRSNFSTGVFTKQVNLTVPPAAMVMGVVTQLNSARAYVTKCTAGGGGCSSTSCTSGLVVSFDSATTTPSLTVDLYVQQASTITRGDYCAKTQVTQTITPRLRP